MMSGDAVLMVLAVPHMVSQKLAKTQSCSTKSITKGMLLTA